jgi:hypothetical protein
MKNCILILGLFLLNDLKAQADIDAKRDQVWIFGDDNHPTLGSDGALLKFSDDSTYSVFQNKPFQMYISEASICDTAGNLIIYSNGFKNCK